MKGFIAKILLVLLIAGTVYGLIFSYRPVPDGMISIVYSSKEEVPVYVAAPGSKFIVHGALPWLYRVENVSLERRDRFDVKLAIPSLSSLEDDFYGVSIPVSVEYAIDWEKIRDDSLLRNNAARIGKMIVDETARFFSGQIQPYLVPFYRGPALEYGKEGIGSAVRNALSDRMAGRGVTIKRFDVDDGWIYPDNERYREGLQYLSDLRKIEIENTKALALLKNRLEGEKIQEEALYRKYREMSRIIKQNPDILKYIYIDKLADDLKVIVSSDRSMVPQFLDEGRKKGTVTDKGEIDNLR